MKKVLLLSILICVLCCCDNTQTSSNLTQEQLDSIENAEGWAVFNNAVEGETEDVAGVQLNVLFKNQATENLSTPKKLTKEQFKAVCKAKPGKDLYFYIDGKADSPVDCYAYIIGGDMEYDDQPIK